MKIFQKTNTLKYALENIGSESHGLELNKIGWISYDKEKIYGAIGLRHLQSDYVIIDAGLATTKSLTRTKKLKVVAILLKKAETYVAQYSKNICTHNTDAISDMLVKDFEYQIVHFEKPDTNYTHPFFDCKLINKGCFPKLSFKQLEI